MKKNKSVKQPQSHEYDRATWWMQDHSLVGAVVNSARKRTSVENIRRITIQSQERILRLPFNKFDPERAEFTVLESLCDLEHSVLIGMLNVWDTISFKEYTRSITVLDNDNRAYLKGVIVGMLLCPAVCRYGAIRNTPSTRAAARIYTEMYLDSLVTSGRLHAEVNEEVITDCTVLVDESDLLES